jgi:SPP1 family predicted phage head-tail adaptor
MKAGHLNKFFEIWNPVIPEGTGGNAGATTWPSKSGTIWGSLEGLSSREAFELGAAGSTATHKITIRYCSIIGSQTKLILREKTAVREFFIDGHPIDPDGRRRELTLTARERVA